MNQVIFVPVLPGVKGEAQPFVWAGAAGFRPRQSSLALAAQLTHRISQTFHRLQVGQVEGQAWGISDEGARCPLVHQRREAQADAQVVFTERPEGHGSEEDHLVLCEVRAQQLLQQWVVRDPLSHRRCLELML